MKNQLFELGRKEYTEKNRVALLKVFPRKNYDRFASSFIPPKNKWHLMVIWLVVEPTHLTNIRQVGNLPPIFRGKIQEKIELPPPSHFDFIFLIFKNVNDNFLQQKRLHLMGIFIIYSNSPHQVYTPENQHNWLENPPCSIGNTSSNSGFSSQSS